MREREKKRKNEQKKKEPREGRQTIKNNLSFSSLIIFLSEIKLTHFVGFVQQTQALANAQSIDII